MTKLKGFFVEFQSYVMVAGYLAVTSMSVIWFCRVLQNKRGSGIDFKTFSYWQTCFYSLAEECLLILC